MTALARLVTDIAAKRGKVIFRASFRSADVSGVTSPIWGWRARTGPATLYLACRMGLYYQSAAKGAPATEPEAYWQLVGDALGTVSQRVITDTARDMSGGDLRWVDQIWSVASSDPTTGLFHVDDGILPVSCTIWEPPRALIDPDEENDNLIDPDDAFSVRLGTLVAGGPIVETPLVDLHAAQRKLWNEAGTHYFAYTVPGGVAITRASATPANFLDTSYTAYNAAAPGWWCVPTYHGSFNSDGVPLLLYARLSATAGTATATFLDTTGTIGSVTTTSGTPVWVTTTATWGSAGTYTARKVDVHLSCSGGGTASLYQCGMYEHA